MNRHCCTLGWAAVTALISACAMAQSYPTKPIRMVVGFPPGGGNDVVARIVSPKLTELLGQQVIVDNRPGATGTVAANLVAKSQPDGYTLLAGAVSTNAIAGSVYNSLPYDQEKDFAPVTLLASLPHIISVTPVLDVKSLKDLIAYAKANPGKLTYASAGNGSTPHIAGEMFKMMTGTNLLHVPYKGAGQSIPDLIAGQVAISFDTTGTIISYVKSGRLRGLAIAAQKRFPGLPDIPTAAEAGIPGYEMATWIAVFAPANTPRAVVTKLHGEIAKVLAQPDIHDKLINTIGSDETVTRSPQEFEALVKRDIAKYAKVVKTVGIKID